MEIFPSENRVGVHFIFIFVNLHIKTFAEQKKLFDFASISAKPDEMMNVY